MSAAVPVPAAATDAVRRASPVTPGTAADAKRPDAAPSDAIDVPWEAATAAAVVTTHDKCDELKKRILVATSAELEAMVPELQALPPDRQFEVRSPYKARKIELALAAKASTEALAAKVGQPAATTPDEQPAEREPGQEG